MAKAVTEVHTYVDQFAAATNMADLLKVHTSYALAYTGKFNRILGVFWSDALKSGDQARISSLRNGLKLLQSVYVAVHETADPKGKGEKAWTEKLKAHPLLCNRDFQEFLDKRALFAGKHNHPSAASFAKMAEYLRFCCKMAVAITKMEEQVAAGGSEDSYVEIKLPLAPERADLWFAISPQFSEQAFSLAERIEDKSLSLRDGVSEIVQFKLPEGELFAPRKKETVAPPLHTSHPHFSNICFSLGTPTVVSPPLLSIERCYRRAIGVPMKRELPLCCAMQKHF